MNCRNTVVIVVQTHTYISLVSISSSEDSSALIVADEPGSDCGWTANGSGCCDVEL